MTGYRLSDGGTSIDRTQPIQFRFDGRLLTGFVGDTLASALIANGVSIVGRSFKYHRPRGVVGSGFSETNALVQLGRGAHLVPNVPATLIPLVDGLEASSATGWPSVRFDLGRVIDHFSGLLGAGFYYKTFFWPNWHWFEPWIRRAAGIGHAPAYPDPDRYEAMERRADVLVIGAGPAGLAAAEAAAAAGCDVVLIEADAGVVRDIGAPPPGVSLLSRTTALGYYDANLVTAIQEIDEPGLRQRLWKIRATQVVIATGAFERPLVFANNDRPGVMLASAVHRYIEHFGVAPGAIQGVDPAALGTTRYRPPFAPVAISALIADRPNGRLFRPWQRLPAHDWHEARGAAFEDFGYWRPSHYLLGGETMEQAARREALAVRGGVGMMDSSSFGKIELKGPNAGTFLDLISVGRPSTIPVGQIRYNLLCDELGVLLDDGVVTRLGEEHFLLNASSAHAARVRGWIEDWHQCQWSLDLVTRDVSEEWAVLTVAGPKARAVLQDALCDTSLSPESFPHLSARRAMIGAFEVRIQRVSFTGELSYEIAVAAHDAASLADWLWQAGRSHGLVLFGIEALEILRIEKGFVHIGTDTDGTTIPADIGWGRLGDNKGDFLGKRSLQHPRSSAPGRRQLVGLEPIDSRRILPVGGHIIGGNPHPSQGFVTSSCFSPTLDRGIALALLVDGRKRHGETVTIWSEGHSASAKVVSPKFFDPDGGRVVG